MTELRGNIETVYENLAKMVIVDIDDATSTFVLVPFNAN